MTGEQVKAWTESKRAKLIDTSKRNRLLFFKPSETATVRLTEPSLNEVFHRLVVEQKPLQFYPRDPQRSLLDFDEENNDSDPLMRTKPRRLDEVRSELPEHRLWKNLYSLRQKSRTSLQEKGVVTLYIAFGLLEWTEAKDSSDVIRSPLLLVPVELIRETTQSPYKLRLFEEDIEHNPTLAVKLQADYGIELPPLPDLDKLNLPDYFNQVISCVQPNGNWPVIQEVHLSIFSFPKITIYNDPAWDKAGRHPITRAMAGDPSLLTLPPPNVPAAEELDRQVRPEETFQTRDADSSQQEAIQAAKHGVSFILQGPPGTGKSQTITNMIAECVAEGKRVLFVSEKMDALKVVYDRLTDDGLGDFCLEAHSDKANKLDVVSALGRALNPQQIVERDITADFTEFTLLRERLNTYVEALHHVHRPSGYSAFQVHALLAQKENSMDLLFDFPNALSITPEALAKNESILNRIVLFHDILANYEKHPWHGVTSTQYSLQLKSDISIHFRELKELLIKLEGMAHRLACLLGVAKPEGIKQVDRLIELAQFVAQSPLPPKEWFRLGTLTPLIEKAQVYQASFEDYRDRRRRILIWWSESLFALAHEKLEARLTTSNRTIREIIMPGAETTEDSLIREREILIPSLTDTSHRIADMLEESRTLAQTCGVSVVMSLSGVTELSSIAETMLRDPRPEPDWFKRSRLITLKAEAEEAREQYTNYKLWRDKLAARYENEIFTLNHSELVERFQITYASPLRFCRPDYYRDMRRVRSTLKTQNKLAYAEALNDLKVARKFVECQRWIEERKDDHERTFGAHYERLDTNWDGILAALDCCRQLVDRFGDGRVPNDLIRVLIESGSTIENMCDQRDMLQETRDHLDRNLAVFQTLLVLNRLPFTDKTLLEAPLDELKKWIDILVAETTDFCNAYDAVMACRKLGDTTPPLSVAQLLANLKEAEDLVYIETTISANATQLHAEFGHLFAGMETHWEATLEALDWTGSVLDWFGTEIPSEDFTNLVSGTKSGIAETENLLSESKATLCATLW